MGTVTVGIALIFAPLYALFTMIASFFGIATGDNASKVSLPYDPEKGLVWEYDNVDDPYIRLKKTEIKDGEQIFYFTENTFHIEYFDYYKGEMMDLIFTDENGNSLKYYAYPYQEGVATYNKIKILAPDEYIEFVYHAVPQIDDENSRWHIDSKSEKHVLYSPEEYAPEKTYTFVYEKGSNEYNSLSVGFTCGHRDAGFYEDRYVIVDFSSGEGVITKEHNSSIEYAK